jgi:hypothetical protein
VVAVAVLLLIVLKDDGGSDESGSTTTASQPAQTGGNTAPASQKPKPEVTTIVIDKSGEPVGGIAEISVDEGDRVHFKVESAVADEIHLHGYDIGKDVEAGGSVTFDFAATIEGILEAELESRGAQILELTVNP